MNEARERFIIAFSLLDASYDLLVIVITIITVWLCTPHASHRLLVHDELAAAAAFELVSDPEGWPEYVKEVAFLTAPASCLAYCIGKTDDSNEEQLQEAPSPV